jgi:hypothetical protein
LSEFTRGPELRASERRPGWGARRIGSNRVAVSRMPKSQEGTR